jgi:chitinase
LANRRKPTVETTTAKAIKENSKTGTKRPKTTPRPTGSSLYIGINTPEPPTTPDPGSDFKCVDEGFFEHPRDCKKYFWCLDSGPSNLGIVAHQFTCPTGRTRPNLNLKTLKDTNP